MLNIDKVTISNRNRARYPRGLTRLPTALSWLRFIKTAVCDPRVIAHGFYVLSETADFEYKCTEYHNPNDDGCLIWNDPELGINWPNDNPVLSEKDLARVRLSQQEALLLSPILKTNIRRLCGPAIGSSSQSYKYLGRTHNSQTEIADENYYCWS